MTYWLPSDEADILAAIGNGVLGESQHLDVKLTYSTQDPSTNTKLAQDVSAFAIDGGAVLVGIRQVNEVFAIEPQPLAEIEALAERVSQVSRDKPSPPVFAPTRVIPSEQQSGKAYLLIEVPPSASAPHSVDGTYWARGDRANRRLTDDREVDRLIRARSNIERLAADILESELPSQGDLLADRLAGREDLGVLYVVAEPVQARDDEALLRLLPEDPRRHPHRGVDGAVWESVALAAGLPVRFNDGQDRELARVGDFQGSDGLAGANNIQRRARGRAVVAGDQARRRREIELREHGGIRLVREEITRSRVLRAQFTGETEVSLKFVDDPGVVATVWRVISTATEIGRRIGYRGTWSFAMYVDGIDGTLAHNLSQNIQDQLDLRGRTGYDQYAYERATVATTHELESEPVQVLYRLVGRLVRGLNVEDLYALWIDGWPGTSGP